MTFDLSCRNQVIVEKFLESYIRRQRTEIKTLNRNVAKVAKARDAYVKEMEESSLQV